MSANPATAGSPTGDRRKPARPGRPEHLSHLPMLDHGCGCTRPRRWAAATPLHTIHPGPHVKSEATSSPIKRRKTSRSWRRVSTCAQQIILPPAARKNTTALWPIGCIPGPLLTSDACDRFGRPHAAGWPMRRWATTTSEGTPARPRSEGIHFSQVPVLQYYWRGCIPRVSVPPRVTHCGTTGRRDTFGSFPGIE